MSKNSAQHLRAEKNSPQWKEQSWSEYQPVAAKDDLSEQKSDNHVALVLSPETVPPPVFRLPPAALSGLFPSPGIASVLASGCNSMRVPAPCGPP